MTTETQKPDPEPRADPQTAARIRRLLQELNINAMEKSLNAQKRAAIVEELRAWGWEPKKEKAGG